MADTEWVLSYPGTTLTLGTPDSDAFFLKVPEIGSATSRSEDAPRPRSDGVAFGQDYLGGRTISFDLGIGVTGVEADGLTAGALVATAWRADAIRLAPGAVAALAINTTGRARVVYGRPRRFSMVHDAQHQGYLSAVAEFATTDDVFYDGTESTQTITSSGTVTVGGGLTAWPVYTISGPANPVIDLGGGVTLGLTLTGGGDVVVDTRPWVRSVMQGSTSKAGRLTSTSRLSRSGLAPGAHTVSVTGASSVTVAWRDSHSSL